MRTVRSDPPADRTPLPTGLKARLLRRLPLLRLPLLRLLLLRRDLLHESGWLESGRRNVPVGRDGSPVPWYTYSAIDFLAGRVRQDMAVFEYGAANSTLWWAARVAHVSAVESDLGWVARLTPSLPENTDLLELAGADGYACSVTERGRQFDVVVIDGQDRSACALACRPALNDNGVVIWDNSDWSNLWPEGMAHLAKSGFRRLDFSGLGPLHWRSWTTSVFCRPGDNCLGL